MVKYNYFEDLEQLSALSLSAVSLACGAESNEKLPDIRRECDRLVCKTEDALFSDFLPPLERDNIAAAAHCLSRIVDKASDIISDSNTLPSFMRSSEEAAVCVRLAEELKSVISMLKHIRKPDRMPDLCGYRQLLCDGRAAHRQMLSKIRSGNIPKKHAETVILTGRLRAELSGAFDEIVEIMLNNI